MSGWEDYYGPSRSGTSKSVPSGFVDYPSDEPVQPKGSEYTASENALWARMIAFNPSLVRPNEAYKSALSAGKSSAEANLIRRKAISDSMDTESKLFASLGVVGYWAQEELKKKWTREYLEAKKKSESEARRAVSSSKPQTGSGRCGGRTQNGGSCLRRPQRGGSRCHLH